MNVHNRGKLILISVLLILLLSLGGYFLVDYIAKKRLPNVLGDKISISDYSYDLWGSSATFHKPVFRLDSLENRSHLKIRASANQASIGGFGFWDLLMNQKLEVADFSIDNLEVEIVLPRLKVTINEKQKINLFIKEVFTQIKVKQFQLTKGDFLVRRKDSLQELLRVDGLSISAKNIVVDTGTVQHVFPLNFGESQIGIDSLKVNAGEHYTLSGKWLQIADTSFSIQDLSLIPTLPREQLAEKYPHERAQFEVQLKRLSSEQLLWDIERDNHLRISSQKTILEKPRVLIFKDKRRPTPPNKVKPLLSQLIKELPFTITVDTLVFTDGYISYEQQPVKFPRTGEVYFSDLYMTAYNLSNEDKVLKISPITTLDVQCQFMGRGLLNATINLDMTSENEVFNVKGELGQMPVTYVNKALAPLTGVKVTGDVHQMNFSIRGDNYSSKGNLGFEYSDLKVSVFDKDREKEWLKSVFGNVILKNKNRRSDSLTYKEGTIYFIRYQDKDFFNYLWNSIRVGLMDTVAPFYKNPDKEGPTSEDPKYKK